MGKNVYSLVLLDNVVDELDKLACERSISRSGLVNQILAEYLSCPTPENRIRDIFSCMEKMSDGTEYFQSCEPRGNSAVCFRSPLHYRYHPAVHYTLELSCKSGPFLGELHAFFRTQNSDLLECSGEFFRFWASLETKWIGSRFPEERVPCAAGAGRYIRRLCWPKSESDRTSERVAEAILAYLNEIDFALKTYFSGADGAKPSVEQHYLAYLKNAIIL